MDDFQNHYPFSQCRRDIHDDLIFYGGKTGISKIATFFFSIPFKLMFWYRISRYLYLKNKKQHPFQIFIRYRQGTLGSCEFSCNAKIGKKIHLPHPFCIVIGTGVIVENDVRIFQQVTLGSHGRSIDPMCYPVVKSGATVYAGAKIIGGVTIGQGAIIGANSVVLQDIPENSTAVGIPAKIKPE